jgi:ABC-2 type transport system ATP-binding protein
LSEQAIVTENLSKSFGAQVAVSELSLKIQPGAVYGFLGRNGAGKTTTMRMLLGLMRPTKGRAQVLGLDPSREADLMSILDRVAFVPQRKQLYPWATPAELVRMNRGFFPRWSDETAARLARRLEIPMKTVFKKLSIGNQSKVALLLALAQEAEVLILDEPTAGLDPVMVDEILRTLVEDHISQGRTIFISSHPSRRGGTDLRLGGHPGGGTTRAGITSGRYPAGVPAGDCIGRKPASYAFP